jgi:hypothetical protein
MHQPRSLALALQAVDSENQMLIIIIAVLVILFFIVVIVVIGLTIFFISRKRKKAKVESAFAGASLPSPAAYSPELQAEPASESIPIEAPTYSEPLPAEPESANMPVPSSPDVAAAPAVEELEFDPTRTVAIVREEEAVTIDYGSIKFTSGVLAGERFPVDPEGVYIGRESTMAQIVVSDPRISKRHLWIGVRDGKVTIADEGSRNGTFVNDPKSARVTEATLNSGDTVIMGESDVARFEYNT